MISTDMKQHCIQKIKETLSARGDFLASKHRTIFHELLDNESLPESDKKPDRLWQEAQLLLAAGTVTTATAIATAFLFLLLDHERLAILLEELEHAIPDINKPISAAELEKLPYLVCCTLLPVTLTDFPIRQESSKKPSG